MIQLASVPTRHRSRRGVALILTMSLLALILTFLIAAQTSVILTRQANRRNAERANQAHQVEDLILVAAATARAATDDAIRAQVVVKNDGNLEARVRPLDAQDPLFQNPVLRYRDGDAVVSVTAPDVPLSAQQFLINLKGARTAAIALPAH